MSKKFLEVEFLGKVVWILSIYSVAKKYIYIYQLPNCSLKVCTNLHTHQKVWMCFVLHILLSIRHRYRFCVFQKNTSISKFYLFEHILYIYHYVFLFCELSVSFLSRIFCLLFICLVRRLFGKENEVSLSLFEAYLITSSSLWASSCWADSFNPTGNVSPINGLVDFKECLVN